MTEAARKGRDYCEVSVPGRTEFDALKPVPQFASVGANEITRQTFRTATRHPRGGALASAFLLRLDVRFRRRRGLRAGFSLDARRVLGTFNHGTF